MKVYIHTFGCKVNTYESLFIRSLLVDNEYTILDELEKNTDIVMINTCSVTDNSDKKSMQYIKRARKVAPNALIIAMGCFIQGTDTEIKEADILIGNTKKSKIIDIIKSYKGSQLNLVEDIKDTFEDMKIHDFETRTRAFVKVQDGCSSYCSYCIIPHVRGKSRSREINSILEEVNTLVDSGFQEIVLTGIHTGNYGIDLGINFLTLLKALEGINKDFRIRISSIEINELTDEVIEFLKTSKKVIKHLHIPLQSGSTEVLKRMNRKYDQEGYLKKIKQLKDNLEGLVISTDVMVGHPFETDEEFLETIKVIDEVGFVKLHVFPYSMRNHTASIHMPQIDEDVKRKRVKTLLKKNNEMEELALKNSIGRTLNLLVETNDKVSSFGHAEVFHMVKVRGVYPSNTQLKVNIIDYNEGYLIGNVIDE